MSNFDSPDSPIETAVNSGPYSEVRICAPGNVRGWRNSSTTARLSWDEPYATCNLCPDAIGYEVYGEGIARKSVVRPPCEITGLKAGVEYLFYVTAKAAGNNVSTPSPFLLLKMRAPTTPGTPELSAITHASVSLSWASSGHEGVISYRVYLNGFLVKQVTQPWVSLTHLQSHTDYRVEVRAVNAVGISEPSFVTFKTRLRPPTNLRFSHRNGICRLAWDPVFRIHPAHELSINGQVFTTVPGRWGYNFKLADVSPGPVPHHLKFAVHARLDGDISDVAQLERTVADDVPPSRPGKPAVSDINDYGATLSWEPSSDNVGVTGYEVVLNGLLFFRTPDPHFTFNKLTSGAYHWVFVRARDKDGNASAGSSSTVFTTTGQAPSPRPSPPEASITALTSTSARLEWQYQEGIPDSGARILINEEHFADVLLLNAIVLNDLSPNVEYSISVSIFDIFGQLSEPTMLVYEPRDVTPPSLPGNLNIADVTADSVTLIWEDSIDDIGVHEYVIYNNHEYFDSTPLTRYTAVDLLPGMYLFEVCAMDFSGNASEPAARTVHIEGQPSSAPTNFRFTQTGLIPTLEWDAPIDMEEVIRYDIVLTGPQGGHLTYSSVVTFLKPVLLPRTRYAVSITARNTTGRSLPLISEITTK
ncbi:fibronectin type III domain-containing protein [Pseudomonas sp. TH41]|uniref:fibronectin type III domain-containing protein n=1 Tax=Pseudomonas sp. TH41 TaxID=2796405 RepID=UPI001912C923|nr:fibronectin type III domain-containing protein [Pseudomonas sp. TH41]MBK5355869.1 fibronectin type III domain-containing protein [Pseudomonas sp. TH41]